MARVFISHAAADRTKARRLAEALRRAGHEPWLGEDETMAGESIRAAVERGLLTSDYGVLCLSGAALASGWVQAEALPLFGPRLHTDRARLLPARLELVEPPAELAHLAYVDLFPGEMGWERGVERLLHAIDIHEERRRSPGGEQAWLPPGNVPPRRRFVGREEELAELRSLLSSDTNEAGRSVVAIRGVGGVGKTALALEYAHRHAAGYPAGIWWLEAQGSPVNALLQLAEVLLTSAPAEVRTVLERLPVDAPSEQVASAVRRALESGSERSLLVLDNVDREEWGDWLPDGRTATLITTRLEGLLPGRRYTLRGLRASEAEALADAIAGHPSTPDEQDARHGVLVDQLDALPLAIELAAQAIEQLGISWSDYAKQLLI